MRRLLVTSRRNHMPGLSRGDLSSESADQLPLRSVVMKWKRWFLRLATEPSQQPVDRRGTIRINTPAPERLGIREVGNCEVCGQVMQARTRREEFRGRLDCYWGSGNHVRFRVVGSPHARLQSH